MHGTAIISRRQLHIPVTEFSGTSTSTKKVLALISSVLLFLSQNLNFKIYKKIPLDRLSNGG